MLRIVQCLCVSPRATLHEVRGSRCSSSLPCVGMSNSGSTQARREEETAFLAMEEVLGVDIRLADAGSGNKMPDGVWVYPDGQGRRGIVEITSPPATALMKKWAAAKRAGQPQTESGSIPTRLGDLARVCTEILETDWARENIEKLVAQPADERHLFLFGRGHDVEHYFFRLSDDYDDAPAEHVEDLELPEGITDVWFRGRAQRDPKDRRGLITLRLARFQAGAGWFRYEVSIEEQHLPAPNGGLRDDPVPQDWRKPKYRTSMPIGG